MKKFWIWMENKKYKGTGALYKNAIFDKPHSMSVSYPTNQMLIGYMIEYLLSKEKFKRIPADIYFNQMNINEFYVYLEKEISE